MRFLVTGGTGFVGRAVVDAAVASGHDVRVLARDPAGAADLPVAVETVTGELADGEVLDAALVDRDVLVHAAAVYSYERGRDEEMTVGNPAASEAVLAAARRAGSTHVVDVSSAVVLRPHREGARRGVTDAASPLWDEDDPTWGDPYLRSKVLAERVTRRYAAEGLPVTSIHPAAVVGPGDRRPGTSGGVVMTLLAGGPVPRGGVGWVDVRDVAAAIVAAAGRPPGGRHLLSAARLDFAEMGSLLDRVTGRHVRRLAVPRSIVRAAARLNDRLGGGLVPALAPAASLAYALTVGPIDGSSGAPSLGFAYRPVETTVRETLAWWVANDLIDAELAGDAAPHATPSGAR